MEELEEIDGERVQAKCRGEYSLAEPPFSLHDKRELVLWLGEVMEVVLSEIEMEVK
ncbi:hypothetical protein ACLOJK_023111, partial [Asimina triloba]